MKQDHRDTVGKYPNSLTKKNLIDSQPFEQLVPQNKPREIVPQAIQWKGIKQQVYGAKPPLSARHQKKESYSNTMKQMTRQEKFREKATGLMDQYRYNESRDLKMDIQPEKADSLNFQQENRNGDYGGNQILNSFGDENFY